MESAGLRFESGSATTSCVTLGLSFLISKMSPFPGLGEWEMAQTEMQEWRQGRRSGRGRAGHPFCS